MESIFKVLKFNCLILVISSSLSGFSQSSAKYTVTFTGTWNSTDHGTLPGNAHWSDLVGASHNGDITFWEQGSFASAGIEDVAELGNNIAFNSEVNTAIGNGNADQWLQQGFSPNIALGTCVIMNIIVTEDHPLLTLVSMIAPSPDWFVGINALSLLDESNNWINSITIDMFPYDAGTEDGSDYSTNNSSSDPLQTIFSRINMAPFNDQKVGTLSIQLEELLSVTTPDLKKDILIYPNPASDHFSVKNLSNSSINSIEIFDMIGNKVQLIDRIENNSIRISRNDLSSGLYLIKINVENGRCLISKIIFN
jgi:hypothetical protein